MGLMNAMTGNAGRMDLQAVHQEYGQLLSQGEQFLLGYQVVRDCFLFTSKRLILVDKQGMTGKKVEYHSVLYRAITQFSVETAGTFDLDAELKIWVCGGVAPICKRFSKQSNIYEVQGALAHFVA